MARQSSSHATYPDQARLKAASTPTSRSHGLSHHHSCSCLATQHQLTFSDRDSYLCLLHRAGAHWIPRMGELTFHAVPATPRLLFVRAAMVPATWVPCPRVSLKFLYCGSVAAGGGLLGLVSSAGTRLNPATTWEARSGWSTRTPLSTTHTLTCGTPWGILLSTSRNFGPVRPQALAAAFGYAHALHAGPLSTALTHAAVTWAGCRS